MRMITWARWPPPGPTSRATTSSWASTASCPQPGGRATDLQLLLRQLRGPEHVRRLPRHRSREPRAGARGDRRAEEGLPGQALLRGRPLAGGLPHLQPADEQSRGDRGRLPDLGRGHLPVRALGLCRCEAEGRAALGAAGDRPRQERPDGLVRGRLVRLRAVPRRGLARRSALRRRHRRAHVRPAAGRPGDPLARGHDLGRPEGPARLRRASGSRSTATAMRSPRSAARGA